MISRLLYCVLLLFAVIAETDAQAVQGKITDESGIPLPGATLYLRERAGRVNQQVEGSKKSMRGTLAETPSSGGYGA